MVRPSVEFTHVFNFWKKKKNCLRFGWEFLLRAWFSIFKSSWRNQILVHRTKMREEDEEEEKKTASNKRTLNKVGIRKKRVAKVSVLQQQQQQKQQSSHSTINKIRVNKINCSTYILIYVITSGYCVFRATDDDDNIRNAYAHAELHAWCLPAKDQRREEEEEKNAHCYLTGRGFDSM